jgi:hypothetical protein
MNVFQDSPARPRDRQANPGVLPLYQEVKDNPALGTVLDSGVYRRIAGVRERMGLFDEALAWHRIILRDHPTEPQSRAAVDRLLDQAARRNGATADFRDPSP